MNEFASLNDRYRQDIAAAEEKLHVQETQIQNTDLELEQIVSTLQFEQQRLEEKMQALNAVERAARGNGENALQGVFASINKLKTASARCAGRSAMSPACRDGSESRLGALQEEISHLAGSLEELNRQYSESTMQVEQNTAALVSQQEIIQQADESLRSVKAALDQIDRELAAEQRTLAEKESKLEVLRS